jgi:hypothetical protein
VSDCASSTDELPRELIRLPVIVQICGCNGVLG